MAVKLSGQGATGMSNPKGVRTRSSDDAFWNTSGTPAFEAYNAANIADYGITAAETGATGVYSFTDPADTVQGRFRLVDAAGASLTVTDLANNVFWEDAAGPQPASLTDKTGFSLASPQAFDLTGDITGNLSGSVGSVGGNIGGNVVGTVASVVGAVGSVTGSVGSVVGNVVGSVGSVAGNVGGNVAGSVGSVTGFNAALVDVAISTRLAGASYTAPDNAGIAAIQAKTDELSFTVSGVVDANVRYVNDIEVDGSGTTIDPWGPV